ncbi:MAG: winged helix-turn-helix transcriptional regulator [Chitinophagales bacterium]|nr:winged helix-turn-helix transcriptional regulator [Chitinophagales bacterium]
MGITKKDIYSKEQNEIAEFAKVLGHPARIAILQYLLKMNTCITNDLVNEIGLAQATISQHLKELKQIGIIGGTIEGSSVCYCIDKDKWQQMKSKLGTILNIDLTNCC